MHRNGIAIINESQKDAYSENFIKIQPQTAKLGVGTVPRPKLDFCCSILAQIYAGLEFQMSTQLKSDPTIFPGSKNHGCSRNLKCLAQETRFLA